MITTITLNVSVDKAYHINETVESGKVIRVATCNMTAGGKGLNVSRVIKMCGEDVLATGFVGGHTGALVEDLLQKDEIKSKFVHTKGETRNCINILDQDNVSTEFLEPGAPVSEEEKNLFIKELNEILDNKIVLAIYGSSPQG